MVISPNRQQAIELLLKTQDCDLIISDDGLQHYKLRRDIEIVVMDAERALGNGFVLPAGPLRELPSRLKNVDFVITNGGKNAYSDAIMQLVPHYAINLVTAEKRLLSEFTQGLAIAGIGNPQRFFTMLENLNIRLENTKAFQDHQHFEPQLLEKLAENQPLFMTEKDAVKCQAFAKENWWYVPVDAEIVEAENQGQKLPQLWEKIRHLV
ncbi:lipid A 4'kinase [Haemophilus parainfluenzae]|uniref:Tetraacyldisaccharide 4'-kinase n=1 Tax=Haemophilus parainfluenzae TaxID=729 RepID=A0A377JHF2_HAEPA|nr:lipid A 4'kinase [Haemophilus parainfluenzae]